MRWLLYRCCIAILTFVFVGLLLSQDVNARQTKTDSSEQTSPPPAASIETQDTADKSPEPHQQSTTVENPDTIGDENTPLVKRISKVAKTANFAFWVSVVAAIFSGLSWLVGRDANKISSIVSSIQARSYIEIEKVTIGEESLAEKKIWMAPKINQGLTYMRLNVYLSHRAGFPANDIKITGEAWLREKFPDEGSHDGWRRLEEDTRIKGELIKTIGFLGIGSNYRFVFMGRDFPVRGEKLRGQRKSDMLYITCKFKLTFTDDYGVKSKLPMTEINSEFFGPCIHGAELSRGQTIQSHYDENGEPIKA